MSSLSGNPSKISIVIANKRYSSWSMRPWLALRYAAGKGGFEEIICNLNQSQSTVVDMLPDPVTNVTQVVHSYAEIFKYSPTKKVPVLVDNRFGDESIHVWESIAIMIHIADTYPEANLFPNNVADRALCLSVISEMHAGFMGLRTNLPVHTYGKGRRHGQEAFQKEEVQKDVQRIGELWTQLRTRTLAKNPDAGPFLFGHFTVADAMYAPVTFRFTTYDEDSLPTLAAFPLAQQYIRDIQASEVVQEWVEAAHREPVETHLERYDKYLD